MAGLIALTTIPVAGQPLRHTTGPVSATVTDGQTDVTEVDSGDPNEIVGPGGAGPNQDVTANQPLSYTVFFENQSTATAP